MQPSRDIIAMRREVKPTLQHLLDMIEQSFLHEIQLHALSEMIRLTESEVGFLCLVDEGPGTIRVRLIAPADQPGHPLFTTHATDLNLNGYWRACVDRRSAVISNGPAQSPAVMDNELGPIARSVTLPIIVKNKIVAVIGVGNRELPYEPVDAEVLQELATGLWRVVIRKQLHDDISDQMT